MDLGAKISNCWRCTCPVHEADVTDGYAEACADGSGRYECLQAKWADACKEYADSHPEEVAAMLAAVKVEAASAVAASEAVDSVPPAPAGAGCGDGAAAPSDADAPAVDETHAPSASAARPEEELSPATPMPVDEEEQARESPA